MDLFVFLFIIATFLLAIRGLVALIGDIKGDRPSIRSPRTSEQPYRSETAVDLRRAIDSCHKLKDLAQRGDISESVYHELRNAIESRYGKSDSFPDRRLSIYTAPPSAEESNAVQATPLSAEEEIAYIEAEVVETVEPVASSNVEQQPLVAASMLNDTMPNETDAQSTSPAPWDVPDELKKESRPWKELLAGFMQEKNIRWGELASGILIVGSAVGLVVSLRNELRETIPYFPALMFMLITAAIHGAGIYTLKKWKLRNTSRGVLLIGLLLVPLNFLAACVLTGSGADQRELSDPVYWLAIGIGVSAFCAMTWFATQSLLSRRYIPMFVSVMAGSIWMLVINRVEPSEISSTLQLSWALPFLLATSTGIGTAWFWLRTNRYTSVRSVNRVWLMTGISAFVFVIGIALFLARSSDRLWSTIALTPLFACAGIMVAWTCSMVWRNSTRAEQQGNRIAGTAIMLLALAVAIVSVIAGAANPIILAISTATFAVLAAAMSLERRFVWIWPTAWISLAVSVLTTVSLLLGVLPNDAMPRVEQFSQSVFSSRAGITLMISGIASAIIGTLMIRRIIPDSDRRPFTIAGNVSTGAVSLSGCLLAVVASFVYPQNRFDMITATSLLGIAAIGITAIGTVKPKEWLPWCAAVLMFAFLGHALFWNGGFAEATSRLFRGTDVRWQLFLTVPAVVFALCGQAVAQRLNRNIASDSSNAKQTEYFAVLSLVIQTLALVASTFLLRDQVGLATLFATAISVAALCNTFNLRSNPDSGPASRIFFSLTTLVVASFGIAELGMRSGWVDSLTELRFWLIQICVATAWCAAWLLIKTGLLNRESKSWFLTDSVHFKNLVLYALPIVVIGLIGARLAPGVQAEFFQGQFENERLEQIFSGNFSWLIIATASVLAVHLFAMFLKPALPAAVSVVSLILAVFAFGAIEFESSRAVVTCLRWSIPIGGLLLAVIVSSRSVYIFPWHKIRRICGLSSRSSLTIADRQQVVNWTVFVVVGVVLLASTITIAIVMLMGKEHLGGPLAGSFFGDLRKDLSFGGPVALIVAMLLLYAISQRRSLLAVAGSCVFQYIVLLSIVLLFLSPHPKLASEWFINILQAVSIGMAVYGIVWFSFRQRVGSGKLFSKRAFSRVPTHISLHTLINVLLFTSLAILIVQKYFFHPIAGAGWIRAAGGPLGYVALGLLALLCGLVWRKQLRGNLSAILSPVLLAVTAMLATSVDKFSESTPWWGFNTILIGSFLVATWQLVFARFQFQSERSLRDTHASTGVRLANVMTVPSIFLTTLFAIRGATGNPPHFWWYVVPIVFLIGLLLVRAAITRSAKPMWIATLMTSLTAATIASVDPENWLSGSPTQWLSLQVIGLLLIAIFCTVICLFCTNDNEADSETPSLGFRLLPNFVSLAAAIWIVNGATADWLNNDFFFAPVIVNPLGIVLIGLTGVLLVAGTWNRWAKFRFDAPLFWLVGIAIILAALVAKTPSQRVAFLMLFVLTVFACYSLARLNGSLMGFAASKLRIPLHGELSNSIGLRMPVYQLILLLPVLLCSLVILLFAFNDLSRMAAAIAPLLIGFCFMGFAPRDSRRWMQLISLSMFVVGIVFLSWTPLAPDELHADALLIPMRTLLACSVMMIAMGIVLPRYISAESVWRRSIRETSLTTCLVALISFAIVLGIETSRFVPNVGCETPIALAIVVSAIVLLLIAALVLIAVRPRLDPLSLSDNWRRGYVYAAQIVALMLLGHAFVSMPQLFQIGLRHYWPYVVMAVAFGGIGISRLLKRRNLDVLSEPLFHTTAILPIAAAVGVTTTSSQSDPSLVMLLASSVYLAIGITGRSLIWGALAVVFGNLALWLFYGKFPSIGFLSHPQLWLIPPAVSVLVAAQINRQRLSATQLTAIRYVCVAVIYISSTSEVFIQGLGTRLWPPIVLALLSVAGMAMGMMFRVRAYLYLGSLFLLLSVISMVSHAQQRLGHTWPWWAFGIGLGIVILTVFGLFEKRRNEMKAVAGNLREWDW